MSKRSGRASLCLALVLSSACAQIKTESRVTVKPRTDAPTLVLGGDQIRAQDYEATWLQLGNELVIELHEHRACQRVVHHPVVRIEHLHRNAQGGLIWEYGLAALTGALAIWAFVSPEDFGTKTVGPDGEINEDNSAAWRMGGVFAGVSGLFLIAGVVDTYRQRDEVRYADAYRVQVGHAVDCDQPVIPYADEPVVLVVGDYRAAATTDALGRARIPLPPEEQARKLLPPTERKDGGVVKAAISPSPGRAVAVDFRVPYRSGVQSPDRINHSGHAAHEDGREQQLENPDVRIGIEPLGDEDGS